MTWRIIAALGMMSFCPICKESPGLSPFAEMMDSAGTSYNREIRQTVSIGPTS
jgi:hypothetical protein